MSDSLLGIVLLFVIAGGGIIMIDYFVLRRIRVQTKGERQPPSVEPVGEESDEPD